MQADSHRKGPEIKLAPREMALRVMANDNPKAPAEVIGTKYGNYRLIRLLGRGQMGTVYLAQDEALLRPTAVKLLAWRFKSAPGQDPVEWFLAEARAVARMRHAGIVQVYNVGKQGGVYFIAMEYVDGASAEDLLARQGPFSPGRATQILLQAAQALQAAHASRVIHRDVKPANILISQDGRAKLTDFGLALTPDQARTGGLRVGTPHYTAPEVWAQLFFSPLADVYALGATYFHLLTGRPPFRAPTIADLEQLHLRGPVPEVQDFDSHIPAGCSALVRKCMAKEAPQRYPSARDVGWAARALLQELGALPGRRTAEFEVPPIVSYTREALPAALPRRAEGIWESAGFRYRPFGRFDTARPPYLGEPFNELKGLLGRHVSQLGRVGLVLGPSASGRTTICHCLSTAERASRAIIYLNRSSSTDTGPLLHTVCDLAGVTRGSTGSSEEALDQFLDAMGRVRARLPGPPLIIADGLTAAETEMSDARLLAAAALETRAFSLVLAGAEEVRGALAQEPSLSTDCEEILHLIVPQLSGRQAVAYLQACIDAALVPHAAPLLVTTDAALVAWRRSSGNLVVMNRIAWNMVFLANLGGARVVTSGHAWNGALYNGMIASEQQLDPAHTTPLWRDLPAPLRQTIMQARERAGLPPRQFVL